ncbi:AraC family transcriptional regulator (plasmid) [Mycolicibacterium psychrotolerans]|uniref:AraC family transcriptional regulator n=1 Tax=Mycolicibacterium psychrotolerans TaxID=216929 RepID=UPI003D6725B9
MAEARDMAPQSNDADSAASQMAASQDTILHPLCRHRVVETSNLELAQHVSSQIMSSNRLRLGRRRRFNCRLYATELDACTLLGVDFGAADPSLASNAPLDYYVVFTVMSGQIQLSGAFGEARVGPGEVFVFSPADSVRMQLEDAVFTVLKIPRRALATHYASLTGRPLEGRFAFVPVVTKQARAAPVRGAVRLAIDTIGRCGEAVPSYVGAAIQSSLLTTVMLGQPSTHLSFLLQDKESATDDAISRAADLIHEDDCCRTIAEVAAAVGLSIRGLQSGFRRRFRVTPSQFQRDTRLDRAHHRLLAANTSAGDTVTAIALETGFGHLGRFSADYRRRFGVLPSTTMRLL